MNLPARPESVRLTATLFPGGTMVTWVTIKYPADSGERSPQTHRVSSFLEDPAPTPVRIVQAAVDAVRAQLPLVR